MVRSGIILSDLGKKHDIKIEQNDVIKEINKRVSGFPGQEKIVIEYYQKNPAAIEEIRGVVLEEKVVNFILEKSSVENKNLSVKDFEKEFTKAFEA
jgi:trigger factor